jgi:hypothetical protein
MWASARSIFEALGDNPRVSEIDAQIESNW